jgi:hypothetical protein
MQVLDQELEVLFRRYNIFILELRSLENSLDTILPHGEEQSRLRELRGVIQNINEIVNSIKIFGYEPSEKELANGFIF